MIYLQLTLFLNEKVIKVTSNIIILLFIKKRKEKLYYITIRVIKSIQKLAWLVKSLFPRLFINYKNGGVALILENNNFELWIVFTLQKHTLRFSFLTFYFILEIRK